VEVKQGENMLGVNIVGARSLTLAESTAIGIDGGLANYHRDATAEELAVFAADDDVITNTGSLSVSADTDVVAVSAALQVAGTVRGAAVAGSLAATDTSSLGYATAIGIDGGGGNDQVRNAGTIVASAGAEAISVSASLDVGFARNGAVVGVALSRAEAVADAAATGVQGGAGNDSLINDQRVEAHANADSTSVAVSVAATGTANGISISGTVADASGHATATATGLDGAVGNDTLRNNSVIDVGNVTADATAAAISVSLAGTNNGVAAGASLADTSANATANALGLAGGEGNDTLTNASAVTLRNVQASSDADSVAVSVTAAIRAGAAVGVAMTDASTHSNVLAAGIAGGDGNDTILNTGTIMANDTIRTVGDAAAMSIDFELSMAGGAAGLALSDASSNAHTVLAGVDGGSGNDAIDNRGAINLRGTSEVSSTSIAIGVHAALGAGGGMQVVDARSNSASTVTGIDGGAGRNDITNSARLDVSSGASADSLGIALGATLAVGGDATLASTDATVTATAVGIGDAGGPTAAGEHGSITNTGVLAVTAEADVEGRTFSGNLRGYALGETSITAVADGHGIQSGEGATVIDNRGAITVTSDAEAYGLVVSATLAGKAMGNANTTADALAVGITAGSGDDVVQNAAAITLQAEGSSAATSVAVTLAGTARTDVQTNALTTAIALDGGVGNDQLGNTGNLSVRADSSTTAYGVQVALAGTTGSDVMTTPESLARAMTGGDGNDALTLGGAVVRINADSDAEVSSSSWQIGGASSSRAGVTASAVSVALDGGSGDDALVQRAGSLLIASDSYASASNSGWTFAGTAGTEAALLANSRAVGLDGGDGADTLRNETAFTASTHAVLEASGGSNAIFGNSSTSSDIGAAATTIGLAGGAGNDDIRNTAALTLSADSLVSSDRVSFSFAGGADISELMKSEAVVTGLDGGDGADTLLNTAAITATAYAEAVTNGAAETMLGGGTRASGKAIAEARATGIAGGAGADVIQNDGALTLSATIAPRANNSSSAGVFFGNGAVEGRIEGLTDVAGIDAGDGNNNILNRANITVTAATGADSIAFTYASGSDFSFGTSGSAYAYNEAWIDAWAAGIRAGNGNNSVRNTAAIDVHMEGAIARTFTDPNGGSTSGDGDGDVDTTVNAYGQGIQLGEGNNEVLNDGSITLTASPVARGRTDGDGSVGGDSDSHVSSYAFAEAKGIAMGDGTHRITSNGAVRVTAAPMAEGYADVNGGSSGGATGIATNYATARAYGFEVGHGSASIVNNALLQVTAASNSRPMDGNINVRAEGYLNGDANAYVDAQSRSEAVGIRTGTGVYSILNTGALNVTANALASASSWVDPGSSSGGHRDTASFVFAEGRATGIYTGGTVDIVNRGNINVTATPSVSIVSTGTDSGPRWFMESTGYATGIDAAHGAGAQTLVNDGNIVVQASAFNYLVDNGTEYDPASQRLGGAPVAVGVSLGGAGYKSVINNGTIEARAGLASHFPGDRSQAVFAYGVQVFGDGVSVVNNGTITAQGQLIQFLSPSNAGMVYAVYMSSRNNQDVTLGLGRTSVTNGNVGMFGGRAILVLEGNPVFNGVFSYNANRDFNLVLNTDGRFNHALPAIANVTKNGAGTYSLPALNSVRSMTLNQGLLALDGGYTFAPTGTLQAAIHADGSYSGLIATGTVNLDGTLRVIGDEELYADGTRYRIVSGGAVNAASAFDAITLPASVGQLSFSTERTATAFSVVANVASFASASTSNSFQQAIGGSLDAAAGQDHSDDMHAELIKLQRLTPEQLQQTYASINPVAYDFGTAGALGNAGQYADALWQRLFDPALESRGDTIGAAFGGGNLSRSLNARDTQVSRDFGMWMRAFGRRGDGDATDAFAAYDYEQGGLAIGYDRVLDDFVVGASVGFVKNRLTADDDAGRGDTDSTLYSLYGGYSRNGNYLDGVVSFGKNNYDLARRVVVGDEVSAATSIHDGRTFSVGLNGGALYERGDWVLGPVASLQYTRLAEDAFSEEGGPLALSVAKRDVDSLASSLGARIGHRFSRGRGEWMPELGVAWLHDFGIGDRSVDAAYLGAPDAPFNVAGKPLERNGAMAGIGISYRSGGLATRLSYRGEFRNGATSHGLFGGLQYVF
jgi:uncharacterized protein with beta-barrel porin domain